VKFIIDNWFLILAALASGGLLLWPTLQRGVGGAKLSTNEAVMLINREKAILIDVSEPAEYAASHAAGARNVPLGSLETSGDLPKNKALPVVVLCPSGARSTRAVGILRKLGYEKSHALAGGLAAWREANLPVEKSAA
jgi:rhodanese-related sulfurtransferase